MKVSVLNIKGKDTGRSVELSKSIFEVTPNDHSIYLDVKRFLANNRQGTNKTKERAEITGSTRKIKNKRVLVLQELVVLKILFLEEVVIYLVLE